MKNRYRHYRRGTGGTFYVHDSETAKQESLGTKDRSEAMTLLDARNELVRQPQLNLQIAKAYLAVGLRNPWIRWSFGQKSNAGPTFDPVAQSARGPVTAHPGDRWQIIRDKLGLIVTLVNTEEGTPVAAAANVQGKGHELKTTQGLLPPKRYVKQD